MLTLSGIPDAPLGEPAFLTIGNFDGVHLGHQALISAMVESAHSSGALAGLLTFDPHPLAVLRPEIALRYLTTPEERAELLGALGLDFTLIMPFTRETADLSAMEFMRQLTRFSPLRELWIGPDFALGRGREGNALRLAEIGAELSYRLQVARPFDWRGEPVRSSLVRSLLAQRRR